MTPVRAVLFDVFGTLVDWRASIATALERFGSERGIEGGYDPVVETVGQLARDLRDRT